MMIINHERDISSKYLTWCL